MDLPEPDIHPLAIAEARAAHRWYLRRSARAARCFRLALEAAIQQITESPERWSTYLHGTRCRPLRRFPYIVVYREQPDRVQVVALAHGRRRPGYWQRRK